MTKQQKADRNGAEQEIVVNEPRLHASRPVEQALEDDTTAETAAEQEIAALLRVTGWRTGDNSEVTEAEAELFFRAAETDPVPEEVLARMREGVLRRRLDTPATSGSDADVSIAADERAVGSGHQISTGRAHRTPTDKSVFSGSRSEEDRQVDARPAGAEAQGVASPRNETSTPRPSLIQRWKLSGRKFADLAQSLRLDRETLLTLDRGGANTVPARLVEAAAKNLDLSRDEAARCLAPMTGNVSLMAAHGRRNAPRPSLAAPREFLEIIEASRLPEHEKHYWRDVVASEVACDSSIGTGE